MSGAPLISPPQRLTKKDMDEGEASEMEVEEQLQPVHNNQSLTNRLGLKNSIQTYFGDDYVFQIVPKDDWGSMAVSLSTNAVKLYSPMTGQCFGECKRHSSTINHISFSGASTPHILHSPPMEPSGLGMPGLFTRFPLLVLVLLRRSLASRLEGQMIIFWLPDVNLRYFSGIGGTRSKLHAWRNPMWRMLLRFISSLVIKTN